MNLIGRYAPGEVHINDARLTAPLLVAPGFLQGQWIADISQLAADALDPVWDLQPRILLLGSDARPGECLRTIRALCAQRQIALEPMDLGGACRTYNVLAQEDRAVVALLFP